MIETGIFLGFLLFFLKHFIVDFPLQVRWMYANKGTLGHSGGIIHAVLHGIATALVLGFLSVKGYFSVRIATDPIAGIMFLSIWEVIIHYFIDWGKMNLNRINGWGPLSSEWYWYSFGADQLLHYLTYLAILYIWFH